MGGEGCGALAVAPTHTHTHTPPLGVRLFLSLFAASRRFSLQPSCHLAVVPLSSFFPLSLLLLSRRSPRCISWPLPRVYRALLEQGRVFGRPLLSFATQSCHCSGPLSLRTLVPSLMMPALGSPSGAS